MVVRVRHGRSGDWAASYGIAGGLLFSVGDISTKLATEGGARIAFAASLVGGYVLGTALLQVGYQRGAALTIAGLATLLSTALPIAAGTVLLGEPIPGGALGVLRIAAFAIVVAGAIMLARPGTSGGRSGGRPATGRSRGIREAPGKLRTTAGEVRILVGDGNSRDDPSRGTVVAAPASRPGGEGRGPS